MSRLVVLHQGAIGDFLLTLSVVRAVRDTLRTDSVTAIATAASARLAGGRSAVDTWLSPEVVGLYRLFSSDLPLSDRLGDALHGAEYVLNFLGGPTERIHHRLESIVKGKLASVDPRPTTQTREHRCHITTQWAADIRHAGWPIADPAAARIQIKTCLTSLPQRQRRVLIHPGSGGKAKCWPIDRFIALAESLQDLDVTWMLGPAECEQARRIQNRDESLLVEEDLEKAAEQMAGFDLYIGNDSGITHLAAAIGLPTVAIFVATDPRIWRPLGDHVTVLAPEANAASMQEVVLSQIAAAVRKKLSGWEQLPQG